MPTLTAFVALEILHSAPDRLAVVRCGSHEIVDAHAVRLALQAPRAAPFLNSPTHFLLFRVRRNGCQPSPLRPRHCSSHKRDFQDHKHLLEFVTCWNPATMLEPQLRLKSRAVASGGEMLEVEISTRGRGRPGDSPEGVRHGP